MKFPVSHLMLLSACSMLLPCCGSRSSDFATDVRADNPLPPCPESPNCVRITEHYPVTIDAAWQVVLSTLQKMKPYDVEISADEYRIDAVFLVAFFRDDMAVQLEEAKPDTTYVHIRSSSRQGYYDFGVNRRRVKDFLRRLGKK